MPETVPTRETVLETIRQIIAGSTGSNLKDIREKTPLRDLVDDPDLQYEIQVKIEKELQITTIPGTHHTELDRLLLEPVAPDGLLSVGMFTDLVVQCLP